MADPFHTRDGLGIRMGQRAGLQFGIVSGRECQVVAERGKELVTGDRPIAVVIETLKSIDHAVAHRITPKRLVLLQVQLAIAIGVK